MIPLAAQENEKLEFQAFSQCSVQEPSEVPSLPFPIVLESYQDTKTRI